MWTTSATSMFAKIFACCEAFDDIYVANYCSQMFRQAVSYTRRWSDQVTDATGFRLQEDVMKSSMLSSFAQALGYLTGQPRWE